MSKQEAEIIQRGLKNTVKKLPKIEVTEEGRP